MSNRKKSKKNGVEKPKKKKGTKTRPHNHVPSKANTFDMKLLLQWQAEGQKKIQATLDKAAAKQAELKELATNTNTVVTDTNTTVTDNQTVLGKHTEILNIIAKPKQAFVKTIEKQRRELIAGEAERARLEQALLSSQRRINFAASKAERRERIVHYSKQGRGKAAHPALGNRGSKANNRHPNTHGKKARQIKSKKSTKNSTKMSPK
jgi:hypothetical protein